MTRFTRIQAAFNYGVLDPHIIERRDTKFVDGSLSDGENIIMLPQGGFTDRGGTDDFGRVRRKLAAVGVTAAMVTLPHGGTAANFVAGLSITTATAASTSRFVLYEIDFGAPKTVHFLDAGLVGISSDGADNALIAEYWTGAAWALFAPALQITRDQLTRRFASGAPGTAGITAQKFRVAVNANTGAAGKVSFAGADFWTETAGLSDGVVHTYSPQSGETYQLVFTDRNADVYQAGIWKASFAAPYVESQLRVMKTEARYDTIITWHEDVQPRRIFRLGSAAEWSCDRLDFDNIPIEDFGDVYTNGVNEVQVLHLYTFADGDIFDITLEGQTTEAITKAATDPETVANVKAALEALPNVSPGLTVTKDGDEITVTFTGENNEARDWLKMTATVNTGDGYISVRTTTEGKKSGEPIMSNKRGWPRVGRFAQQRLIMAGLKSQPLSIVASLSGSPFDLNTELGVATSGFTYNLDSSDSVIIHDIFVTSALLFIGDRSIIFNRNKTLSATETPEFGTSDAPGIDPKLSPVSSVNGIMYVQDDADTLIFATYSELNQTFLGDNASILSASLIRNVQSMARRRPEGIVDSDLIFLVNADGTITTQTQMQGTNGPDFGYAPWSTDGQFRSVAVDRDNETWFLVDRPTAGGDTLRLERHAPDALLDEATEFAFGGDTTELTGLSRFEGRTVWAIANDCSYGPFPVEGGKVTLPDPCRSARVGTWLAPLAEDPDVRIDVETRRREARLKRVNRMQISLVDTTSLAIRANDGETISVPLLTFAEVQPNVGPHAQPKTGVVEAEGMHGFTRHGRSRITQTFPGRLTVRSVNKDIVA